MKGRGSRINCINCIKAVCVAEYVTIWKFGGVDTVTMARGGWGGPFADLGSLQRQGEAPLQGAQTSIRHPCGGHSKGGGQEGLGRDPGQV